MMKRLIVILEVISLIMLTTLSGLSKNKSSILASFSPSKIEFVVDSLSKVYSQYIDVSVNVDAEDWELFYQLDITGIPKERILFAQGVNPAEYFYKPFSGRVSLARGGKNKGNTFLPRINIKFIPSWLDNPGVYSGNIVFSYSYLSEGKRELVSLGSIPIVITIKPIFSITVWSESRGKLRKLQNPSINNSYNTVTFLVPKPGKWESQEVIHLTVNTNYNRWSIQCLATELVEYEESKKSKRAIPPISPDRLYIKGGDLSNYTPFSSNSSITIVSGENSGGDFTISFMLETDESVMAGEYKGSITFSFQGLETE